MENYVKNDEKITRALSGLRHVAKIYLVGFDVSNSNCFTRPNPRPRLHPVIKIEFMFLIIFFSNLFDTILRIFDYLGPYHFSVY